MFKRLALAIALLGSVALVSCGNPATATTPAPPRSSLQIVSTSLLDLAQGIGQLQTTVIAAAAAGTITEATESQILTITLQVSRAGAQANQLVKGLSVLAPGDKMNILAVFQPVIASVNQAVTSGLIPTGNQTNTVRLALTAVQGVLGGIQIALTGAN